MNKEKLKMLEEYLRAGITPILLEDLPANVIPDAVVLNADCDLSSLNGHYEDIDFVPPRWYSNLIEKSKYTSPILVIDSINKIPLDEQLKFIEIFKYRKISTFELPEYCTIIVTCNNLKEKPIHEDIYSFMIHI